jgi:hypothetical protein
MYGFYEPLSAQKATLTASEKIKPSISILSFSAREGIYGNGVLTPLALAGFT